MLIRQQLVVDFLDQCGRALCAGLDLAKHRRIGLGEALAITAQPGDAALQALCRAGVAPLRPGGEIARKARPGAACCVLIHGFRPLKPAVLIDALGLCLIEQNPRRHVARGFLQPRIGCAAQRGEPLRCRIPIIAIERLGGLQIGQERLARRTADRRPGRGTGALAAIAGRDQPPARTFQRSPFARRQRAIGGQSRVESRRPALQRDAARSGTAAVRCSKPAEVFIAARVQRHVELSPRIERVPPVGPLHVLLGRGEPLEIEPRTVAQQQQQVDAGVIAGRQRRATGAVQFLR